MVNYSDAALFNNDSLDKQLSITYSGGSLSNVNMDGENFSIDEILNDGKDIRFGQCNSSKLSFTVGYTDDSTEGKVLTVKTTPYGGSAFQFGNYKVVSDKPTADRKRRNIVAYDRLYDVLNFDVAPWYNSYLQTDKTLKQVRDEFFNIFGIIQKSITLPNDSMTVKKTFDPKVLTGKSVLNAICEINGCYGRIGRDGQFEYVFLAIPGEGLFPSETLYPANDLYPKAYGFEGHEIAENGKYISCKYEDYLTQQIDKLQILNDEGAVAVTVGNGNNTYIIKDNFLVFGKESAELTTIANNIFDKISGIWYRPCTIDAIANPCLECGDGIRLVTADGKNIDTIILHRKISGIQSLRDTIISDGLKKRENDRNGVQEQILQTKDNVREVKTDLVEARTILANEIQAERAKIDDLTAIAITTENLSAQTISASQITTGTLNCANLTVTNLSASSISSGIMSASRIADANGLAQYTGWYETDVVWEVTAGNTVPVIRADNGQTAYVLTSVSPSKHHMAVLKGSAVT